MYEAGTAHVLDCERAVEEEPDTAEDTEAVVRAAALDTQPRDFPCLSHCSFQFDAAAESVHLVAYYRSHYMFDRAYGNYLALGHLCAWVAQQAGLKPGTLTVMAAAHGWTARKPNSVVSRMRWPTLPCSASANDGPAASLQGVTRRSRGAPYLRGSADTVLAINGEIALLRSR